MKNDVLLLFALSLVISVYGQNPITFDRASIPNAPAFVLLDKTPTIIERPDSPKAFGIQLLQDFEDGVLDNIALEFTPFWYTKPKALNALKMRGIERIEQAPGVYYNKQNYFSGLRFTNISVAYSSGMDSIQNIAIGARATIFEYKHPEDVKRLIDANAYNERILKEKLLLFNEFMALPGKSELAATNKPQFEEELQAYIEAKNLSSAKQVYDALAIKPVFALDGAIAYNARYVNDRYQSAANNRFGVWLTAAYAQPLGRGNDIGNYLNLYGFFRYLNDEINTTTFNAVDVGVKAELEFDRLSFGYEYISRSGDLDSFRSSGSLVYKLTPNLYLSGAFGNNFGSANDLISLLGIRWGLNNKAQTLN